MDVTRRCDYAFRILRVAYLSGDSYVSVSDISEREGIPYAFARSIQHDLVKGGLIKTVRGARGGLALNCDPGEVTMRDVLEVIQGPVSVSNCVIDSSYCEQCGTCVYNGLWRGADKLLNAYFGSITLKDVIEMGWSHPSIMKALSVPDPDPARRLSSNELAFDQAVSGLLSDVLEDRYVEEEACA